MALLGIEEAVDGGLAVDSSCKSVNSGWAEAPLVGHHDVALVEYMETPAPFLSEYFTKSLCGNLQSIVFIVARAMEENNSRTAVGYSQGLG